MQSLKHRFSEEFTGGRRFVALIAVGVGVTLITGLVHGRLTQRWGPSPDLQAAANNLRNLPTNIGDWELLSEEPIKEEILQMLSCAGYVNRQYVNRKSGDTVSIAIVVGPPGPTSVHTPEICYSSRAYTIHEPRSRKTSLDAESRTHSFWSLTFRTNGPSSNRLRVYYAWCSGDVWTASESPRVEFAGQPLLYKLQLAAVDASGLTDKMQDQCEDFLSAFLQSGWNING
jgi:hypothetical protein